MAQEIKIFNNLTRMKEIFQPITPGEVKFYSCGPTTYDLVHVGNARAFVVGDLIYRIFEQLGYKVSFVRNFTDVDDKIINRARELQIGALEHSARFVEECKQDMNSLGMRTPTFTPKVSESIPEIIAMIEQIIRNGFAYEIGGEVFFDVPRFQGYGKLSKKDLESLEHGIRVEVDSKKRHPSDFVLWKPEKTVGVSWDSPWGKGRPGWHIECSAMISKYLGETIDLHHGGVDLMFPHHENEIAQSEAAWGKPFANYWCHNEFLVFGSEKMSKSLGNVVTIRAFVEKFGGEVLRQLLSSVHYRSKMDWTDELIERSFNDVERIHQFVANFEAARKNAVADDGQLPAEIASVKEAMVNELANDFNVPGALGHFFSMIRWLNREYLGEKVKNNRMSNSLVAAVEEVLNFVENATGLVHRNYQAVLARLDEGRKNLKGTTLDAKSIEQLLEQRKQARNDKDWKRADAIRDQLKASGVVIKDNPDGTVSWSYG